MNSFSINNIKCVFSVKANLAILFFVFLAFGLWSAENRILTMEVVKTGYDKPTDIQFLPVNPDVMLVLEKNGKMKSFNMKSGQESVVVDLEKIIATESEEGLLGLAFHPDFAKNKLFYLNYVTKEDSGDYTVIGEFVFGTDTLRKPSRVILKFKQPYKNHNGGQIAFGKDRYLYIATGDGGHRDDPHGNGQNMFTMLGKILRIDPSGREEGQYSIPPGNPFADGATPEIYAYGLRNPWRFSFDALTGELYAADVGQDSYEEIDIIQKGGNYGWNIKEGDHCFQKNPACSRKFDEPVFEYSHKEGNSVTGGYVYRGKAIRELNGFYIFGDFVNGSVRGIKRQGSSFIHRHFGKYPFYISTFGQDARGEIYLADYKEGIIYKIKDLKK